MVKYAYSYSSPVGTMMIITSDQHILEIIFGDQVSTEVSIVDDIHFVKPLHLACQWLDDYFAGTAPAVAGLPLFYDGTAFQTLVWKHLLEIPYGQTSTYGQIANQIALERGISRMSAQAVGQAVRANPISVLIPCHRVIGADGKLTGYAGGMDKKLWLLNHEKAT